MNDKPTNDDFEKDIEAALKVESIKQDGVHAASAKVVSLSNQLKEMATAVIQFDRDMKAFEEQIKQRNATFVSEIQKFEREAHQRIEDFRKRLGGVL